MDSTIRLKGVFNRGIWWDDVTKTIVSNKHKWGQRSSSVSEGSLISPPDCWNAVPSFLDSANYLDNKLETNYFIG